ncbi:hypothetical protein KUTeg_023970 [Tegillarca granosa]|uniref:Thymosin beta n=1 Tax=Tegillarca granosa TaxID=220873 RepID=A0ABQ9DVZ3_TEGGR|nr:hypothetical protein KUTeg_023970 [Tegillarca granosa]
MKAIQEEKTQVELRHSIDEFDKQKLKHTQVDEKNPLPDQEALKQEKQELEFRKSIGEFDKQSQLKPTPTEEKNPLPDFTAISEEKREQEFRHSIEGFDKSDMKHTKTAEKVFLPSKADIEAEKAGGDKK